MGKIVFEEETNPAIPVAGSATLFIDSADEVLSLRLSSGAIVKYNTLTDVLVFRGVIDCSGNPNYPAADAGDTYKISVSGKIGGGAGASVEAGDMIICIVDGSPSGTQAAVGSNWAIIQTNVDGAVIGPASATNNAIPLYDGTTGKLLKDSVLTVSGSTITGSVTGNAGTVTTNANLTGAVTSVGNATSLGSFSSANLSGALTDETGTGVAVFATSPTLVTPALGTPSALVGTNITGTASGLTAGNVTTNANLTGAITSVGNATSLGSFSSANLASALTDETGTGANVFATSPTLVTPALGTPSALVGTNITGTASGLTAGTVTTNANLTGVITSVGNATSLGSFTSAQLATALTDETGTGANVFAASPTLSGTPLSTTAAVDTNTTQIATTAFVLAQASATSPLADAATAVVGTSTRYAREGHVHPYAVGYQVQSAASVYTTSANLTTTIPLDDTIPQNTEGTEILTVTITPKSATNNLIITFSGFGAIGTNNRTAISALFQDSTANALTAAASEAMGVDALGPLGFVYTMAAGTTSATTFKVRVGPDAASTLRLNGTSGARRFGGVAEAVLTVREIQT